MQFTKYTGLGNDFVLLDGAAAADLKNPSALATTICNRRFGVGADGLVLLLPSAKADIKMRIFNSDGRRQGISHDRCFYGKSAFGYFYAGY